MEHLLLASSGMPSNIFPWLFLVMMMNRFLRRSPSSRGYLHPQCQDDQVFVMLQRIIYSESHFLDPRFRLLLMSQFGLTIFLMNGLMRPCRLFFYGIDRVKRWFPSPPQQIQRTITILITILSNPLFQKPPFELSFSIKGFSDWDKEFRCRVMKGVLLSIPADFAELPEFLALVRHLIVAENPFWNSLVDVFICNHFDEFPIHRNDDYEKQCPGAFQNLLTTIKSSTGSQNLLDFAILFQLPEEHGGQVIFPNDCESFIEVIEKFVTCMFQNLSNLPWIKIEDDTIYFSSIQKLSPDGIALSQRIMKKLRRVHSLKISDNLMKLLSDKNFEDSPECPECLVYRGFELLLNLLKLIQESNGVIYAYIHACILIQTSTDPQKIWELRALRDLLTSVIFWMNDESPDSSKYDDSACKNYLYLKEENRDNFEKFLLECLLEPDFLQTLEVLLQCSDDFDLEDFAKVFMDDSKFVEFFRRYIQEKPRTWSRA